MDLFLIPIFFSLLLVLIVIIYLVPLDIAFAGSSGEEDTGVIMTLIWGFLGMRGIMHGGSTNFEILLAGHRVKRLENKKMVEAVRKAPQKNRRIRFSAVLNAMPVLWPIVRRILVIIRDSVHLRKLDCEVVYGSDNPVLTGMLYGVYCATILPILPYGNAISVRVNPVFNSVIFNIRLDLKIRLNKPFRPFIIAAALLLRKDSLDTLRMLSPEGGR